MRWGISIPVGMVQVNPTTDSSNSNGTQCHPLIRKNFPVIPSQPLQGFNQGGASESLGHCSRHFRYSNHFWGLAKGIVNSLRGLVSPQLLQQQPSPAMGSSTSTGTLSPMTSSFNRYYTPSTITSPGIQGPNASGGQHFHSLIPILVQPQFLSQNTSSPTAAGGGGNGNRNPNDPIYSPDSPSSGPPAPATCRLNGCNKPVFVDSVSNLPNEYCSQTHRE
jgi:hypothetical protein